MKPLETRVAALEQAAPPLTRPRIIFVKPVVKAGEDTPWAAVKCGDTTFRRLPSEPNVAFAERVRAVVEPRPDGRAELGFVTLEETGA